MAKTVGKDTIIDNQNFSAGDLITIKDPKEAARLVEAGVIRTLQDSAEVVTTEVGDKGED
ncbi:hypothetical protein [Acinetobacter guerrae]|uniref:hypothetical protein n=1 Tax=Acinetobacter guerrae TaxID=1843371 RepID=UPI00128B15ED|nr:hypothetical protein [Acinetobacter guerrae]